jgi:aldose 1-epimerase
MKMEKHAFGTAGDGRPAEVYLLKNNTGMEVEITNYGGIVLAVKVPDQTGKLAEVVLLQQSYKVLSILMV